MSIIFASIVPHPPIILPLVGSDKDRKILNQTIEQLNDLEIELSKTGPELMIISSPHTDWGVDVPLYFLNKNLKFRLKNYQRVENPFFEEEHSSILPVITDINSTQEHFDWGKEFYLKIKNSNLRIGLIASGDLSHCLKKEGPYGFHSDGPLFDKELINFLKNKNLKSILLLNKKYPEAANCGLNSFSFILGILEASKINYQPEVLSYQNNFGVGYLVLNFKIK